MSNVSDDDIFGGGFGAPRPQQPTGFTFASDEMNPFGDNASPWDDGRKVRKKAPVSGDEEDEEDEDEEDEEEDKEQEAKDVGTSISLVKDTQDMRIGSPKQTPQNETTNKENDEGEKISSAPLGTPPVKTTSGARRIGVIKRGLKSSRVLGKQLSPTSFKDPLSSAVAEASEEAEASNLDISTARQSHSVRSSTESQQHPHPYDQQLSPPLQQEQLQLASQHIRSASPTSPTPPSSSSTSRPSAGSSSRAYLGTHQRRRSLNPTSRNQMPQIRVGVTDPVKVSDALKSHIAYKIHTQSDAPMFREHDMVVRRRYRDFDWLIQELVARHPGIIVPPIPEKQSMGRFEDEFVEARRSGLESCLTRISKHPVLWCDDVFRLFLEADDFAAKARVITENRVAAEINGTGPPLSGLGGSGSGGSGLGGGGSASSLFGDGWGGSKYKEKDEWFARRMQELDAMEEELRAVLRALEYSQRQRRELSIAHGELGEAYLKMAGQELSKNLSNGFTEMGSLQQKLKAMQGRQGMSDYASFQLTTDEYIRMIGSVRNAFSARGRAHGIWQTNLNDLIKKRKVFEGYVQHPSRASPERLAQLKSEIARAEIRTETSRNAYDDVSLLLKQEMARFDNSRVYDFQTTIESYLNSVITTQEEIVTLWENYLISLRSNGNSNSSSNESGSGPAAAAAAAGPPTR